jgi:hypothetical protein
VLDIDAKHGEAHAWWATHRDQLPPTRTVRTRSGGLHLWYRDAPGLRCNVGAIASGVDVRATGGYVIAWHVAGLPVLRETSLAPWPAWLRLPALAPSHRDREPLRVPDDRQTVALVRFVALACTGRR